MRVLVLLPGPAWTPAAEQDHRLLARHADIEVLAWRGARGLLELRRAAGRSDVVLAHGLGLHALAAALAARRAGRRSIAVAGGTDVVAPEVLGLATWRPGQREAVAGALDHTDLVLAGSAHVQRQCALLRSPRARGEVRLCPTGIDTAAFRPGRASPRLVLAGGRLDAAAVATKRLDAVVEAARLVPEAAFGIVGVPRDAARLGLARRAGANVTLFGPRDHAAMPELLQGGSVWVEASRHEPFGTMLAEAMACGAVPVATRAGALPEVAGDAGPYLEEPVTPGAIAAAVRRALGSGRGRDARERIVQRLDVRHREAGLVAALEGAPAEPVAGDARSLVRAARSS